MKWIFQGAVASWTFNGALNRWGESVSSVKYMNGIFHEAKASNQPLDSWDVSSVKDMSHMFLRASSFDHNILEWNLFSIPSIDVLNEMFHEDSLVDFRAEWAVRLEDPAWKETWRVDREERRVQRRKNENWKRRLPQMMAISPLLHTATAAIPLEGQPTRAYCDSNPSEESTSEGLCHARSPEIHH
jgi:hypothetical protein